MSKPGCCLWNLAVTLTIAAVPGALSNEAAAQSYPSRPITMIVPFPAGGPTDAIGRIVAEAMRTRLGQPVIIENAPGGAGRVAAARAVRAAPDGYTLSLGNTGTHVFNGAIHNLPFDLQRDFAPVAAMTMQPMIIDGRHSLPAKDLRELIAWAESQRRQSDPGHGRSGQRLACLGLLLSTRNRDAVSIRTLHRVWHARPDCRADRYDDRPGGQFGTAGARGNHQGLCDRGQEAPMGGSRDSNRRGSRLAGVSHGRLARVVGAQGHAAGRCREAQRGRCRQLGRPGRAFPARRSWTGHLPAR